MPERSQPSYLRCRRHACRTLLETEDATGLVPIEDHAFGLDVRPWILRLPAYLRELCSGNILVVASSASVVIALTWGGVKFAWSSVHVLVPLIVGLVGLGLFLIYKATYAKEPLVRYSDSLRKLYLTCLFPQVPFMLVSNRTSLSGYVSYPTS